MCWLDVSILVQCVAPSVHRPPRIFVPLGPIEIAPIDPIDLRVPVHCHMPLEMLASHDTSEDHAAPLETIVSCKQHDYNQTLPGGMPYTLR